MCALCEKKWLKELMDQKKKDVLFFSMFFLCFFLGLKRYFDMCFDNLIKFYASQIFFLKTHEHLKSAYLSNYLKR